MDALWNKFTTMRVTHETAGLLCLAGLIISVVALTISLRTRKVPQLLPKLPSHKSSPPPVPKHERERPRGRSPPRSPKRYPEQQRDLLPKPLSTFETAPERKTSAAATRLPVRTLCDDDDDHGTHIYTHDLNKESRPLMQAVYRRQLVNPNQWTSIPEEHEREDTTLS